MAAVSRFPSRYAFLYLILALFTISQTKGAIGEDGLCPVYLFTPFTIAGKAASSMLDDTIGNNPGFSHMVAAVLAMKHFNDRDPAVVPELSQISDCRYKFDINSSIVFDSGSIGHKASRDLFQARTTPCAMAGPFNDQPALELSTMAQAAEFPIVVHRGFNQRLVTDYYNPYTSLVYPDLGTSAKALYEFLIFKGRTDFISILYALTDTGMDRREAIAVTFDDAQISWNSQGYEGSTVPLKNASRNIHYALEQIKKNGYRTIVVALEDAVTELPAIAEAAAALDMTNGEYFWVWFGLVDQIMTHKENSTTERLLRGSAWLSPLVFNFLKLDEDKLLSAWRSAGTTSFVELVNQLNPIQVDQPGYILADKSYFLDYAPEPGARHMYDAVMSVGFGACLARANQTDYTSSISGQQHQDGIRIVNFTGATGSVRFSQDYGFRGARDPNTILWAAINLFPEGGPDPNDLNKTLFRITDFCKPGSKSWTTIAPFVYADGSNLPPDALRDLPDQNYLNSGIRIFGLILMGTAMMSAIITIYWVYKNRAHRILRAAQPEFLYVIAVGAFVSASTIFTLSFDESDGWTSAQLGKACMAAPWLFSSGHIMIYGALFTKLWRVNRVLQFARRKIEVKHVAMPMASLFLAALILLSLWTGLDSLFWERVEVDEVTGASIGHCEGDHIIAYAVPLLIMLIIPVLLTGFMAWKTKDVDEAYSESWWIFMLFLLQLEVVFVGLPVVIILRDVSTNGRYFGYILMLWTFPMSTIAMIMGPKVYSHWKSKDATNVPASKRGKTGGIIKVSGLEPPTSNEPNHGTNFSSQAKESSGECIATETSPITHEEIGDDNRDGVTTPAEAAE